MTYTFKLSRRIARLRAPLAAALLVALAGCDGGNSFDPDLSGNADQGPGTPSSETAAAYAGGIPIGIFAMPNEEFGAVFNGAMQNNGPQILLQSLAQIKARGGKVIVMFAGSQHHYKENGHFSYTKWKARIDRFKGVNFTSYVNDGTIIGHYILDEPDDPANWNGQLVSPSVVEEMARYSKSLWPGMATIVRAEPGYLAGNHKYLDAAWAQYLSRKGSASDFLRKNVADAQQRGLGLVVGINLLDGGTPNLSPMSASEVEEWGSAMLGSTYPCAFISWTYDERFLAAPGMRTAMAALRRQAENRSTRTCGGSSSGGTPTQPPPTQPPPSEPPPVEPPAPPVPSDGVPFGPIGVPMNAIGSFSGGLRGATTENVLATAAAARQAGAKVVLRLTSGDDVSNANGTFSLTKWKAAVDRYARVNLNSYIADGTIAGHMLVQNPANAGAWGGQRISYATLEQMAQYSRQRWPGLTTIVQESASMAGRQPVGVAVARRRGVGVRRRVRGRERLDQRPSERGREGEARPDGEHERPERRHEHQPPARHDAGQVCDERDPAADLGLDTHREQPRVRHAPVSLRRAVLRPVGRAECLARGCGAGGGAGRLVVSDAPLGG